jgi:hypothetical protein
MPRLSASLLAVCALGACAETTDVYQITETLESNTCGSNALPLQDGTRYRVQLKPDPPRASWKVVPKGATVYGSYDPDDGKFHFSVAQTLSLDGMDAGMGQLQCTVIRTETLTGTLTAQDAGVDAGVDAGEDDALRGEHAIEFTADSNGSCRGASGPLGPFDRLPCAAKYAISGVPKD